MPIILFFLVFFDIFISRGLIGDSGGLEVLIFGMTDIWWCCNDINTFFALNICFFGIYTEPMLGKVYQIFSLFSFVIKY